MPPINRLTQGNGRIQSIETKRFPGEYPVLSSPAAIELKRLLQVYPGTVLVIGLVAGGIIGWLTSKRSR